MAMSKSRRPGADARDHCEQADWVAISKSHGSERRIHKVDGDPGPDELQNGDAVDVACQTTLIGKNSVWQSKPAGVFPIGYHPLCSEEECFGPIEGDQ